MKDYPTDSEWLSWAAGFQLPSGMYIAKRQQRDGTVLYSVAEHDGSKFFWTKEGSWEWEPIPSDRTDDYLKRARYQTLEEAWDASEQARNISND